MQQMIRWQISEHSDIIRRVCEKREALSAAFFSSADEELKGTDLDLRAITAIVAAGLYYLVLHDKADHGSFCEIDLHHPDGIDRLRQAISTIFRSVYKAQVAG